MNPQKILFLGGLGALLLAGCSSGPTPPGINLQTLSLTGLDTLNQNAPITVDLVMVYDDTMMKKLEALTANAYFSSIDQLRRNNMSAFDIWRWEVVPGQVLQNFAPVMRSEKGWGSFIFMDYQAPGEHRIGLGKSATVNIVMGEKEVQAVTSDSTAGGEQLQVYPVSETILLNTHTPTAGMTQQTADQANQSGSTQAPPQSPPPPPTASAGNEAEK